MAIKSISIEVGVFGRLILTVTEDYDYGNDSNGMPNSLSSIRTRYASPSDMIEIIKNNVEWKS